MLKSFSTQLAATAFFGPIGLAYTSMATAVLFTLVLAVLYFTGFGALAILVIWPVSIVTGVLYVKFHNDRIRQSGNSLLLGPGYDGGMVSAIGSWARGLAVLAVICGLGYLAYLFLPGNQGAVVPGRIVDASSTADNSVVTDAAAVTNENNQIVRTDSVDAPVSNTAPVSSSAPVADAAASTGSGPVITLPSREIPKVVVDSSGESTVGQQGVGESGVGETDIVTQSVLYVDRAVVNLRQGPGTQYAIVTQLDRNEALYEFARDGEWVNIETEAGNYAGWIHGNLVRR